MLSAALELWHLGELGTPNAFYAAAVLSMTQNWHAFLFNSLDPVGFVTIDKPPLGFWIQVASAKLLGFSGFSILLPEALATVGSVALLHAVVKQTFGKTTGLLAALMLALMPVSVEVGRNNTIDSLLVFSLLLAVVTVLKATERGSLKWLLATGAIVGLGFEIKMMEAYLVVPALGLVYLVGAPVSRRARVVHLALAAVVMLGVSLAWPVWVDLTPATLRPWMDSTQNNSAISLAFGYNGIQRLVGQRESIGQFLSGLGIGLPTAATATADPAFGGAMFSNGAAGPLRLLDQQLGGQASWLLPLALVGIVLGLFRARRNWIAFVHCRRGQAIILFGTWLLTAGAFFSVANFFHSYYLVTLAPPIAALAAIGVCSLFALGWSHSLARWLLPVALVGAALVQAHILAYYPSWSTWLIPLVVGGTVVGAGVLAYALVRRNRLIARVATGLALASLFVAPAVWSGYTTLYGSRGGLAVAGPQVPNTARAPGQPGSFDGGAGTGGGSSAPFNAGRGSQVDPQLVSYLDAHQDSATYLVATPDSNTAASVMLASNGRPVMSVGGFSGSDPILTLDQFETLVDSGQVRYVLVSDRGGFGGPQRSSGNSAILSWVAANGTPVPSDTSGSQASLYDLAGQ